MGGSGVRRFLSPSVDTWRSKTISHNGNMILLMEEGNSDTSCGQGWTVKVPCDDSAQRRLCMIPLTRGP